MKRKSFWYGYLFGILIGLVAALFILYKASDITPAILNNYVFTDLSGKKLESQDLKGKAVVLNLWATWCTPCVREMPSLNRAQQMLKDDAVTFIVASEEPVEKISNFGEKMKLTMPLYNYVKLSDTLNTEGLPATYIFNKKGEVVYSRIGAIPWDEDATIAKLKPYFK
jgi:thiol-disulfide isomerase/thioredoxin